MRLEFRRHPFCVIADMSGELDLASAPVFRRRVEQELRATGLPNLVLNLKGLNFIDSTGLGTILGRHREITAAGGKMILTEVPPKVASMLEMAGLTSVLVLTRSEEEALNVISRPRCAGEVL